MRLSPHPVTLKSARSKQRAGVHISQEEAETAVNDFLAEFSSLYDDVPKEERRKVLSSIPLASNEEVEDDSEYSEYSDSDVSSESSLS